MSKHVSFNLEPQIHIMYTWDYAYRTARKGDWKSYYLDRLRFQKRIDDLSKILQLPVKKTV